MPPSIPPLRMGEEGVDGPAGAFELPGIGEGRFPTAFPSRIAIISLRIEGALVVVEVV